MTLPRLIAWPRQVGSPPPGVELLSSEWIAVREVTHTLTNAQVKALPGTLHNIIEAPGSGLLIVPLYAVLSVDTAAGAYTNLDPAGCVLGLTLGAIALNPLPLLVNDPVSGAAGVTAFLGVAGQQVSILSGSPVALATAGVASRADVVNKELYLTMSNGAGALTGGDAANSLVVTVGYREVAI